MCLTMTGAMGICTVRLFYHTNTGTDGGAWGMRKELELYCFIILYCCAWL